MGQLRSGYEPQGKHKLRHGIEDTIKWLHWSKSSLLETRGYASTNWMKYKEMEDNGDIVEGILMGRKCYIDIKMLETWYESI